jgi:hypothetical protein
MGQGRAALPGGCLSSRRCAKNASFVALCSRLLRDAIGRSPLENPSAGLKGRACEVTQVPSHSHAHSRCTATVSSTQHLAMRIATETRRLGARNPGLALRHKPALACQRLALVVSKAGAAAGSALPFRLCCLNSGGDCRSSSLENSKQQVHESERGEVTA